MLTGKVLVTGGAGFLARGIYERARRENWPCSFTAFSRDDHKHSDLWRFYPEVKCVRGDVSGDTDYLAAVMSGHDTVIHAAANKHVDLSEFNVIETIKNNVEGSKNVARAAIMARVNRVIGISTDKVCHSVQVYGMTKALMEKIFVEANDWGDTIFTCTRYGNVLGSTGSVLTVWRKMIERDGFVTATDPDMSRFWLTVDQAVSLILIANQEPRKTVCVPLLKSLRMSDIRQWYLPDAEFKYAGLRSGEKRHEELLTEEEYRFVERMGGTIQGAEVVRLHPSTDKTTRDEFPELKCGYRTNKPIDWLTRDEFESMTKA
jgi:UDP-N-acetylglucosamine 4,6-dehydratase/5-epimerase